MPPASLWGKFNSRVIVYCRLRPPQKAFILISLLKDDCHNLPEENTGDCLHDDGHDGIQEVSLEGAKGDYRLAEWVTKLAKDTTVPETNIRTIFEKAEELLADSTAITAAPLQGEARMVKSKSNPSRPHLVQVVKGAKLVCDDTCPMLSSLQICSHCVAVAHDVGCLNEFVEWYVANAKKAELTTKRVPRSGGKESSHSRYSQKKSKTPIIGRVPPSFPTPSQSNDEYTSGPSVSKSSKLSRHVSPVSNEPCTLNEQETSVGANPYNSPWCVDPYPSIWIYTLFFWFITIIYLEHIIKKKYMYS